MSLWVVDASIAVKWYVPEEHSEPSETMLDGNHDLHAPDLILPEFGNIVWKKIRRGEFSSARGRQIIGAFLQVPMQFHSASSLIEPAFEAADRTGQTVYDCTYLVLAVTLNCRMVTADEKFFQAISQTRLNQYITWISDLG